jgi:NitT/TauT family transport system substrate-binding protein
MVALALLVVLIASCGGGTDESTTTAPAQTTTTVAAAPTEFTVLVTNPALYPYYEAYVEKRGLKVSIQPADGTAGAIQSFAAGVGQIVYGDMGSYLRPEATKQFTPVCFYMVTNSGVFDIVVPEDSPIKTGADLNGKVIGANAEEDPGTALIRNLDTTLGIKTEILFTGDHLQALAAMDRGEIAAYAGSLPDIAVLLGRGIKLRSVAPADVRSVNGGSGFWSKRETMDTNPAAFKAFVAAIQEAHEYIGDDPQKLVDWSNAQEAIPAEDMAYNVALAKVLIGLRPTDVTPLGFINPATWTKWWDGLIANKVLDPSLGKPEAFFTNEFQSK